MHLFKHYANVLIYIYIFNNLKKKSKEEQVAGHPVGNAFLQAAIKGLLFIRSRTNSQLEHLDVTGPCLVLLSHIFQSSLIENKTKH